MSKLVYLAGPMDGLSYEEGLAWREQATKELAKYGIQCLSPMRGKDFLKGTPMQANLKLDHFLTSDSGITRRDINDVMNSGAVLFNLLGAKKVSIGTMIEYGAAGAFRKPIISIIEPRNSGNQNVHEHPMVRDLTTYRVDTLESGILAVRTLFAY